VLPEESAAHEHVLERVATALVHFQQENVIPGRALLLLLLVQLAVPDFDYVFAPARNSQSTQSNQVPTETV
jgi:hypothetical protein